MGLKENLGKVRSKYERVKEDYESRKAIREAKELEKLRKNRIRLEGKAERHRLKRQEMESIAKSKKELNIGKKPLFSGMDFGGSSGGFGGVDIFGFPQKSKKKRKKDIWDLGW